MLPRNSGFEKIERRLRHVGRLHLLGIIAVEHWNRGHGDPGSVLVFHCRENLIEAVGLEVQQRARLIPPGEILHRLELQEIRSDLVVLELLVDLGVQHIAEVAFGGDGDAREALLESVRRRFSRSRPATGIEHQRLFELRLLV